jgi:glutamate N-acetyltransferase/amino-acid N-acetyltransferase
VQPNRFAESIMTTDRYPKMAWTDDGTVRCLGIAKGAGMVEPNLATMLGFILTDAVVEHEVLKSVLRRVSTDTFNALSVDGDQSTSDAVVLLANGRSERRLGEAELVDLITPVCDRLARAIVENGEGTEHVIELQVRGVADREQARAIGRHVLNSPLVKTAVSGNDPNVGRLLAATGDALSTWDSDTRIDAESLRVSMFGREIYADGRFLIDAECEAALSDKLRATAADATVRGFPQGKSPVSITLQFSGGGAEPEPVRLYGSDLSHEYIRENADYRT